MEFRSVVTLVSRFYKKRTGNTFHQPNSPTVPKELTLYDYSEGCYVVAEHNGNPFVMNLFVHCNTVLGDLTSYSGWVMKRILLSDNYASISYLANISDQLDALNNLNRIKAKVKGAKFYYRHSYPEYIVLRTLNESTTEVSVYDVMTHKLLHTAKVPLIHSRPDVEQDPYCIIARILLNKNYAKSYAKKDGFTTYKGESGLCGNWQVLEDHSKQYKFIMVSSTDGRRFDVCDGNINRFWKVLQVLIKRRDLILNLPYISIPKYGVIVNTTSGEYIETESATVLAKIDNPSANFDFIKNMPEAIKGSEVNPTFVTMC